MLVYPICIQTYDQVSILRNWSKVRLHRAVLLGFGLKLPKTDLNIVKVGMHSYFPNKLVEIETPLFTFLCVPLKWVSKSTFKFDFLEIGKKCDLLGLGLTKVQNSSKSLESVYAWLSLKWESRFSFRFHLQESRKSSIS